MQAPLRWWFLVVVVQSSFALFAWDLPGEKRMASSKRPRKRRLESAVAYIHERWGPDAIRQGQARAHVAHVSTGFPELDAATGTGGIPRGRLSVLSGTPTSG